MPIARGPSRSRYAAILISLTVTTAFIYTSSSPREQPIYDRWANDEQTVLYNGYIGQEDGNITPGDVSRTLVVASMSDEDTSWITNNFFQELESHDLTIRTYVVDDPNAPYTVPVNRGHEAMPFLTHIIDNYHNLTDITMFMHSHQITWHNNDLLLSDSVKIIQRLRVSRVLKNGYMNLRCHHDSGCPQHITLSTTTHDIAIPEATILKESWLELFPSIPPPSVLSQPCCSQFALSRSRIRSIPLDQYIRWRDWLINTPLTDQLSGRVWEYLWQYIFAGVEEFCPEEWICYCDGYGVCFEDGEAGYQKWFEMRDESRLLARKIQESQYLTQSEVETGIQIERMTEEEISQGQLRIEELDKKLDRWRRLALVVGNDDIERARILGSEYSG